MTLPIGQVLVSDDIRHEVGGKSTIVGVYAASMDFPHPEMPPLLARLGITFLLRWPDRAAAGPVTLQIYGPADQENALARLDLDPRDAPPPDPDLSDGTNSLGLRGQLLLEQVPLRAPGAFTAIVSDADNQQRIMYLPVRHKPLDPAQLMAGFGMIAPGPDEPAAH